MIHSGKFGFLHISIFYRKKNLFHPLILRQLFYKSPSLQLQPQVLAVIACFKLVLALIRMKRLIFGSLLSHVHCPLILLRENLCKTGFMSPHKLRSWRTSAACLRCFCNWRESLGLGFVFVKNKCNHFYCKAVMKNDPPWDLEVSSFILVIHHQAMKHITLIFKVQK